MKKKLFQYAILFHEIVREPGKADVVNTQLIVKPDTILAINEEVAKVAAVGKIPDGYQDKLEYVEILVGPF
jgi:hypothetical protein